MGTQLPTPNTTRTASGAPGKDYWQNRVDYDIKAELDDQKQRITASEVITFFNQSPDELRYLWVQLDQNNFQHKGIASQSRESSVNEKGMNSFSMARLIDVDNKYGYNITAVKDAKTGQALRYTINETMMRVDIPATLKTGQNYALIIDWNFNITDSKKAFGRSGFEY
ncbi:MAG: M1 family peptidase, partial [Runella slithyformis]